MHCGAMGRVRRAASHRDAYQRGLYRRSGGGCGGHGEGRTDCGGATRGHIFTTKHMPCIHHAHTMHISCIYHAYTMHIPCTYHAYTMHMPCIYQVQLMDMVTLMMDNVVNQVIVVGQ